MRAENITFADPNVKAICLTNWDADHDGELSKEEASAVKTLGTVFRDKTNIGCFPELKYFTGLTTISEYAFSGSSIGPEIVVPGNVKSLEAYCFNNCKQLHRVILEEGVDSIGYKAFSGPISFLSLPASLIYIDFTAINPYVNVYYSGLYVREGDLTVHVHATEPAAINKYAFYYVIAEGHLIVPFGSIEAYKAVEGWSHFGEYLEEGDVNGDGLLNIADIATLIAYVTGQEPKPFKAVVADVNGDGAIDGEDVTSLADSLVGRIDE